MLSVSASEQYFTYALNRARHDPVAYQTERSLSVDLSYVQPRAPLAINSLLMDSTEFKSTEMATYNYFGHTSAVTGKTPNELVRGTGYALPSSVQAGGTTWLIGATGNQVESIAAGFSTADAALEALIVDAGINPPGHRIHLLGIDAFNGAAREIGVGYATNAAATYRWYWAIHATLSTDTGPYLTGVTYADGNSNSRFNEGEGLGGVTITATGPTGTFTTTSISVGGWSMKVPAGQYIVTASGGGFSGTSAAPITVGTDNVELDFVSGRANAWVNFTQFANSAPVLSTTTSPSLPPVVIGTANPAGVTVAALLGSAATDVDPLAARGIAITAATGASFGTWQYSLDAGATWVPLGAPTTAAARLLRVTDLVRLLPAAGATPGTASISYRAWDQTTGTAGGTADTSTSGGSTAFSAAVGTATATSVLTNTAPVLAATGGGSLDPVAEETASPPGTTIAQIIGSSFSDVDPGTPAGLVVTAVTGTANGVWSWSVNDGATWTAIDTVSAAAALPLRVGDRLRFVPAANFNGTATVTYRGWDQSTGRVGVPVDVSAAGTVGGTTAFSNGSATASVTVTPVNDAPTFIPGKSSLRLKPVPVNATISQWAAVGTTVGDLLGNAVNDVDAGASRGIAIIATGASGQFYRNSGTGYATIVAGPSYATLLPDTDTIYFEPTAGFSGSTTLTFRLWDQTSGTAGHNGANLSSSGGGTGGTTAFGSEVLTATIFVGAAGTPPTALFGAVTRAGDGRTVASIPVTFSRSVEGLDVGDFSLTRGGVPVSLAGATLTGSGASFVLGNLSSATTADGTYSLSLVAALSGITDTVGNRLATGATAGFSVSALPSPPTDIALSATSIAENSSSGAAVGTFSTTDPDGGTFTYALVPGTGSDDNASFSIVGNELRAAAVFDFETRSTYSIRVRSTDPTSLSTEKVFTISVRDVAEPPSVPTLASAIAGNAQVALSWTAPATNGGGAINDYVVEYSSNSGSTWTTFIDGSSSATAATVTGLTNGTAYVFRVSAVNPAGTGSPSANSAAVTPVTVPGVPTSLAGTAGSAQVALSWSAPAANGGAVINDYVVEFSGNSGSSWSTFPDGTSTATSTTVTGLTNGTAYIFRVSAVNSAGTGPATLNSAAVTPATAPGAPTNVVGTAGNAEVALTWTAPASTGGAAITDYVVQYSSNSGSTWSTFSDGTSTATSATVTGLTNGTAYIFWVAAVNPAGTGAASANSAAVTPVAGLLQIVLASDTGPGTGDWITKTGTVNVSGLAVAASWEWSRNAGTTWTTGSGTSFTLPAGSYAAGTVRVRPVLTPASVTQNATTIVIDSTAPAAPVLSATPTLVTVGGLETGATWKYSLDAGTTWTAATGTSFALPVRDYALGAVRAVQTDLAGNDSPARLVSPIALTVTPLVTDSFARADGTVLGTATGASGPWTTVSGSARLTSGALVNATTANSLVTLPGFAEADVRVEATVDVTAATAAGMVARSTGAGATTNLILGWISRVVSGTVTTYRAELWMARSGTWTQVATATVAAGTGSLRLDCVGRMTTLSFNGQAVINFYDTAANAVLTAGTAGVRISGANAKIDDFAASRLVSQVRLPAAPTLARTGSLITVSGLEPGTTWKYSLDSGTTWTAGTGTSFALPVRAYAVGEVRAVQTDLAGSDGAAALLPSVPLSATPLVSDNFARADGTLLGTATGASGAWTTVTGAARLTSGALVNATTINTLVTLPSFAEADVRVEATVDATAATAAGVVARSTGTGATTNLIMGWISRVVSGTVTTYRAELWMARSGTWTQVATATVNAGTGPLRLDCVGRMTTLSFNGQPVINYYDTVANAVTTAGTAGVRISGANAKIDDFAASRLNTDLVLPVAPALGRTGTTVTVGSLGVGNTWRYSLDSGTTWTAGTGTSFTLPVRAYAAGEVRAVQMDGAGNAGPAGLLPAVALVPTSLVTDSFTRADGTVLGTATGASGPWTTVSGSARLTSNALVNATSGISLVNVPGIAESDVRVEAAIDASAATAAGLVARMSGSGTTLNLVLGWISRTVSGTVTTYKAELWMVKSGVWTQVATATAASGTGSLRLDCVGRTTTLSLNGQSLINYTDTAANAVLAAGTAGVRIAGANAKIDDFAASRLGL